MHTWPTLLDNLPQKSKKRQIMKVGFQVMLQPGRRWGNQLQSVTGELRFVEMISGLKKKKVIQILFKTREEIN